MNPNLKKILIFFLALCVGLGSTPAFAKGPKGGGGGAKNPAGHTPPGWSKGKKKGWHGESMPPGLEKKQENEEKTKKDKE